jgi:hypothetical protein
VMPRTCIILGGGTQVVLALYMESLVLEMPPIYGD